MIVASSGRIASRSKSEAIQPTVHLTSLPRSGVVCRGGWEAAQQSSLGASPSRPSRFRSERAAYVAGPASSACADSVTAVGGSVADDERGAGLLRRSLVFREFSSWLLFWRCSSRAAKDRYMFSA